jgi:pantoate--beta-alanine ligase
MGALHDGHRSLIRRAVSECDRTVVSIFVNPAQFGPSDDYARYPRPRQADLEMLRDEGVDAAFLPDVADLYPEGFATGVSVRGALSDRLEGAHRPGHFDGVALVVAKLLVAARPQRAYFGRKDAQQCAVVTRLAADLDTGAEIVTCPTVRDADGLALSSRNAYLSPEERRIARAIPEGLARAARSFEEGRTRAADLRADVLKTLQEAGIAPDYVAVVDSESFTDVADAGPGNEMLVAAKIGSTRLIDQMRLGIDVAPVVVGAAGAPCTGS